MSCHFPDPVPDPPLRHFLQSFRFETVRFQIRHIVSCKLAKHMTFYGQPWLAVQKSSCKLPSLGMRNLASSNRLVCHSLSRLSHNLLIRLLGTCCRSGNAGSSCDAPAEPRGDESSTPKAKTVHAHLEGDDIMSNCGCSTRETAQCKTCLEPHLLATQQSFWKLLTQDMFNLQCR